MMKKIKSKYTDMQAFKKGVIAAIIVICLVGSGLSLWYYKNLHVTISNESKNYLEEITLRIGKNLDRVMKDNFAALKTMGSMVEELGHNSVEDVRTILDKQREKWQYKHMVLIDSSGKIYDINGHNDVFAAFGDNMRKDIFEGKQTVGIQMVNNREYIIFAIPLNNISIDGREIISLAATYDLASVDEILSMKSFDEQAYSQIITKAGTAITRTTAENAIKSGYNIFVTLDKAKHENEDTIKHMREEINKDKQGQISFSLDGKNWYMVYTPIQPDEWYLLTFVPTQAVNANSDMLMRSTLFICGVIIALFCCLITTLIYVFGANRRKLEQIAYIDDITGGNTIERFYQLAKERLDNAHEVTYAIAYTNIENFKILNSQLGRKSCDEILKHFYTYMKSTLKDNEEMGRQYADNFCFLLEYHGQQEMRRRMEEWETGGEIYINNIDVPWEMAETEMGIYVIEDAKMPFTEMIDRAKLALRENRHIAKNRWHFAFYDEVAREKLFREKRLTAMMYTALEQGEFQLYLQPKIHLPDEKVGGAEALVRWISKEEGMIYPNDFIPLFEKNGFVVKVDLRIFEEVCKTIRSWLDRGITPVKISVNCSRVHFGDPAFLTPYIEIAGKYGIDKSLIEIELTESIVFEDTERLMIIIKEIRAAGFGCSMDDFGSGYSSLNMLQSVPVDTLKIDKIFFQRIAADVNRTEIVVRNIVKMAKDLSLITVAEGVEHIEQVGVLKSIGCDYVQGYVFQKPMPVSDFNAFAFNLSEQNI